MEATAGRPGYPGSTGSGTGIGGHIHQLLALATALARTATPSFAGTGPATAPASTGPATAPASMAEGSSGVGRAPFGLELGALSDTESMDWAQTLEHLSRLLAGLGVQAAADLADRVRAGRYDKDGFRTPAELLTSSLKLGRGEAHRRLRLAEHLLPATDGLTGTITAPTQPVLAAAFFAGDVSLEQALIISSFTDEATHLAQAGQIPEGTDRELEETLTSYALVEPPDFLRPLGLQAVNLLNPDGQRPTEGELLAKQGIFFRRPHRGLVGFDGHLTILQYETMLASIDSATNPNQHKHKHRHRHRRRQRQRQQC
ncbi:hypothetical protein AOC05_03120 [Arthrobacter alpinus]|uniref:DUF222 domain-containing protein n=1 Tax=Arthrobacter alpinus TaxID=656366 RepID=A0A0M4R9Y6_9MICC|nr:DUF222 domain-containing protein [Arthrobacter alpinus]ALE91568.1 hypothetical protein AOC05_03120 [Arthrobacter alpinus]